MHITIDTNHPTELDIKLLKLMLGDYLIADEPTAPQATDETPATDAEPEQPKRARRTKLEIAFDTAKEAHDADPTELAALVSAAEELKAKDPGNDRLKDFNPDDYQPTPDSEDADEPKSETAEEVATEDAPAPVSADSISMEELKDLATQLISSDRSAMVELLKQFNARRLSEIPESDWGLFAAEIRTKLA